MRLGYPPGDAERGRRREPANQGGLKPAADHGRAGEAAFDRAKPQQRDKRDSAGNIQGAMRIGQDELRTQRNDAAHDIGKRDGQRTL